MCQKNLSPNGCKLWSGALRALGDMGYMGAPGQLCAHCGMVSGLGLMGNILGNFDMK